MFHRGMKQSNVKTEMYFALIKVGLSIPALLVFVQKKNKANSYY